MPPLDTNAVPIPAAINVMDVLRGVWRRKLLLGCVTLAALGAGLGLVKILKPIYSTEAQVLIQSLETPYDRVQATDAQRIDTAVDDRVITSQIAVVQSDDLGRRVVASLGLDQKPEFNSLLKGIGTIGQFKIALGFADDPRLKTPEERALGRYLDQLSVYQTTNSNVIVIKYTSTDPATAASVANMLAETYVLWTRESQSRPTERAREWLAGQISELRQKLAGSEEAVENFRAEAGLLQGATVTLGTQEISELNSQITVARTASSEARAKADAIREVLQSKGSVESSAEVLASAAVQRLKEQRTEAGGRVAELSATYLDNHPKMIAARSEVEALDRQIRAEALKVVASLEEQVRVADAREKSLRASLESLKSQETSANLDDVKLKALEREVTADRALLETLLSRYAEASTRQDEAAQPGTARIIQTASVPTSPSFPKTGPLVVLVTLAGAVFALGLAFLLELMAAAARLTQRVNEAAIRQVATSALDAATAVAPSAASPQPAPLNPSTPPEPQLRWKPPPVPRLTDPIAVIPQCRTMVEAMTVGTQAQALNAASQMAAWGLAIPVSGGGRRIGLASLSGSDGDASVASVLLARTYASMGKRVALADLSRTGSWLESLCAVTRGPGLAELVTGAADFTKVIGRDSRSTAHLLRYGQDRGPQAATLVVERAESVLQALIQSYEFVIVHLGVAQQDTPALLHKCDGAIIVAPAHRLDDAGNAVQALISTGLKDAAHVLIESPTTAEPLQADGSFVRRSA